MRDRPSVPVLILAVIGFIYFVTDIVRLWSSP